ncbi:cyclic nucleotide-binding domain-containing protein [Patescibacteria group bacterium]
MNETNPILSIINQVPLFKDLTPQSTELLSQKITLEYYPANHQIFRQGDAGDAMYIIKKGQVKIFQGNEDEAYDQTVLSTLSDGSFFGEMALISEKERNANATTLTDCEIFVLKSDEFYKLINENPTLTEQIGKEFINRIKENMRNKEFNE